MAELRPVVFSASIDNEHAIREWVEQVQALARRAEQDIDDLMNHLRERPHIQITLHADGKEGPE